MGKTVLASALFTFLIIVNVACAQNSFGSGSGPTLHLASNKDSYESGESGFVVLMIDTYGIIKNAVIEVEILNKERNIIGGDIQETEVPESAGDGKVYQTMQTIYNESVTYFGPERKVYRTIDFDLPLDLRSGNYTIVGRVVSPEMTLSEKVGIHITGPGGYTDVMFLAYIAVLGFSFYLIRRG